MLQRQTVSGQRSRAIANGVVIGVGIESVLFSLTQTHNATTFFLGFVLVVMGVGIEMWNRSIAKKLPDIGWRWNS